MSVTERCGQHPVTLARSAADLMWSCFPRLLPTCGCVHVSSSFFCLMFDVHRLLCLALYCFSCVFGHGLRNTMCPGQNVLTCAVCSLHLLLFFFTLLLSYSIVSTAWAHCVSLILVPSVPRQHASLKRQGTVNISASRVIRLCSEK